MRLAISTLLIALSAVGFAKTENFIFLPKNDLHLEDGLHFNPDMTEEKFNEIIDSVVTHYESVVTSHGANLVLERNWTDGTVNAYASQQGTTWRVAMFGGLARRPEVTEDGFALVVCHELGHHLAGFVFYGNTDWAASEGQSDYFATQACAKKIWGDQIEKNAEFRATVNAVAKAECDNVYSDTNAQNLCYRTAMGGHSLAHLLASLGNQDVPQFDTPDRSRVASTNTRHPRGQCRLDTYFQGALCSQDFDIDIIPARNHPEGQTSIAAELLAGNFSCTQARSFVRGRRPNCWYASQLSLNFKAEEMSVSEVEGNGNSAWEPGEVVALNAPVANNLGRTVDGLTLSIEATNRDVEVTRGSVNYPTIEHGQSANAVEPILVKAGSQMACGTEFTLTSKMTFGDLVETASHDFIMGQLKTYYSQGEEVATPIPDQGQIERAITLNNNEVVKAVDVNVNITHTYSGDVIITLIAPSGKEYIVRSKEGGGQDDIVETRTINVDDENTTGEWKLRVEDAMASDTGTLNSWSIDLKKHVCEGGLQFTAK